MLLNHDAFKQIVDTNSGKKTDSGTGVFQRIFRKF